MTSPAQPRSGRLLLAIDLLGTAIFAAEGATTAVAERLDLLGILVLAFATALGGGIIRDLLIGDSPPSSIRDWRYAATALTTGAAVFVLGLTIRSVDSWSITTLDAAGLSVFAVAGATKARAFHLHPLLAVMMGAITGVGGGTIRDLLTNHVPVVLTSDIYASAAILGAAVSLACAHIKLPPTVATLLGIAACFTLRLVAVYHHWNLPGAAL